MIFVDTNVLIYAAGLHGEDDIRTRLARAVMGGQADLAMSVQVIREFFDASTRRARISHLSDQEAISFVDEWRKAVTMINLTPALFDQAITIRNRYGYRYYDCEIIAAALSLGCDTLYSEDMQHGQIIDGLTIINPFL